MIDSIKNINIFRTSDDDIDLPGVLDKTTKTRKSSKSDIDEMEDTAGELP